jgi:hypothetical protein
MSSATTTTTAAAQRFLVGIFEEEEQILDVTKAATDAGLPVFDTFTPYAVHGLDQAQKLPRSNLPFVTLGGATTGFLIALSLQVYSQAIETPFLSGWPIIIGGKPFLSMPAFIPVLFELTVLIAGLSTAVGLFAMCKLWPSKKPSIVLPRITDDRFAIALDPTGPGFDESRIRALLHHHGASEVTWVQAEG